MPQFRMLCHFLALGACSAFLTAAAPPPFLTTYIHNGNFEAGDYAFIRGAFAGASAQQLANWKALQAYGTLCMKEAAHSENEELKKLGINAQVDEESGYQDHLCTQIAFASDVPADFKTWDAFHDALARSQPYFQTYKSAVNMAVRSLNSDANKDTFEEQLTLHTVPDQMWRFVMMGATLNDVSGLDAATRSALRMQSILEGVNVDWVNSHWARHILETQGWSPAIKAGRKPAMLMWLLVQHADEDPAFQVMALQKLEPLAKTGQFSKQNYALLSDRVMLATTGKQHYGSQLSCHDHQLAPYSMDKGGDNSTTLDARRSEMNLPPEAAYIEHFRKSFPQGC
ncbi:DUF6624 domain-containing protein [Gluconobacter sp. Dm-44]|uniref:DUF6624 domain-containing protein n=1 Tax=Gluconobacter sp. Dm-44 TaxID=2799805 RepID=UPI001B8A9D0A|nr:DUF6624 domain-containing protein [Gluconobacter sp. Dm-44]MBS1060472.1 hypothetical protein [Gluconobacter sp. Dm-44]